MKCEIDAGEKIVARMSVRECESLVAALPAYRNHLQREYKVNGLPEYRVKVNEVMMMSVALQEAACEHRERYDHFFNQQVKHLVEDREPVLSGSEEAGLRRLMKEMIAPMPPKGEYQDTSIKYQDKKDKSWWGRWMDGVDKFFNPSFTTEEFETAHTASRVRVRIEEMQMGRRNKPVAVLGLVFPDSEDETYLERVWWDSRGRCYGRYLNVRVEEYDLIREEEEYLRFTIDD